MRYQFREEGGKGGREGKGKTHLGGRGYIKHGRCTVEYTPRASLVLWWSGRFRRHSLFSSCLLASVPLLFGGDLPHTFVG